MKVVSLLLGIILLFYGCKEETVKAPDPRKATDSLQVKIKDNLAKEAQLQAQAKTKTEQIPGYSILRDGLLDLSGMTIADTKASIEEWVDATLELQIALLDSVSNRAINSRMSLLRTKVNILKQEVDKRKVDTSVVNIEATEFYNAFQDLTIQLNREYGSSVDQFLEEFEKESQKLREEARKRRNQDSNE